MVWALQRIEKEKPAAGKTDYWHDFWRRRWDSNPRTLADQLISSQSRYDHFDTSPYLSQHQHLRKRGELMGRTSKNIKLRIPEKPRKIKGFRSGSYRVATTISSAPSYDVLSNAPQHKFCTAYYNSLRGKCQFFAGGKMSVGCICNERLRFLHDVLQGRQVVQNVAGFQGMIGVLIKAERRAVGAGCGSNGGNITPGVGGA